MSEAGYQYAPSERPLLPGSPGIDVGDDGPTGLPVLSGLVDWYRGEGNANDSMGSNNGTLSGVTFAQDAPKQDAPKKQERPAPTNLKVLKVSTGAVTFSVVMRSYPETRARTNSLPRAWKHRLCHGLSHSLQGLCPHKRCASPPLCPQGAAGSAYSIMPLAAI